jgi:hypothetical protein
VSVPYSRSAHLQSDLVDFLLAFADALLPAACESLAAMSASGILLVTLHMLRAPPRPSSQLAFISAILHSVAFYVSGESPSTDFLCSLPLARDQRCVVGLQIMDYDTEHCFGTAVPETRRQKAER